MIENNVEKFYNSLDPSSLSIQLLIICQYLILIASLELSANILLV